jgi:phosphoribosylformylglycinamidine (FGAM) synthase-like enzyme
MSPLEIWCNESQERYVLIVAGARAGVRRALRRERCPFAVIGEVTDDGRLRVDDPLFGNAPVDVPLETILGKPPRMTRDVRRLGPPATISTRRRSTCAKRACACCACRRSRTRPFSSRSATVRRRHDQPRSDGRSVAGAGQRRRA